MLFEITSLEPKYNVKGEPIEQRSFGVANFVYSERQLFEEMAQEYGFELKPTNLRSVSIPLSKQKKVLPREYNRRVAEFLQNMPNGETYSRHMNRMAMSLESQAINNGVPLNPVFVEQELRRMHNMIYKYANDKVQQDLGISKGVALTELELYKRALTEFGFDYE